MMKSEVTKYWEDLNGIYPYAEAVLYVYCDNCGSFSVKSLALRNALLIVVVCLLMGVGTLTSFQLGGSLFWILLCLAICIFVLKHFWRDAIYECRKCGSKPTTEYNTLDYPSDTHIVDIPQHLIQTRILEYWPDSQDIDLMLKRPEPDKSLHSTESFETWECEECGATIAPAATACPFCGAQFEN